MTSGANDNEDSFLMKIIKVFNFLFFLINIFNCCQAHIRKIFLNFLFLLKLERVKESFKTLSSHFFLGGGGRGLSVTLI